MFSGVTVNEVCVCPGDREPDPTSDTSSLGNAETGRIYELWNALVRQSSDPCYVPCVIDIRNVLATRMNGAKGERRVADPSPRNGTRISDGGLCACCRIDFQSVEMVEMRWSTASPLRFRFALPFAGCILNHTTTHKQMNKTGMRTPAAALPEMDCFFALAASFMGITPESISFTSAEAGVPVEEVI